MGQDVVAYNPTGFDPDDRIEITRSQLTRLFFETHKKASCAAEEVMCLKEIGKINGLYEDTKPKVQINIQAHAEKLEVMTDEELLRLSGAAANLLDMPTITEKEIEDAEIVE